MERLFKPIILTSLLLSLLLSSSMAAEHVPEFSSEDLELRYRTGKEQVNKLHTVILKSKLPHQGECWRSALENLQMGCSSLTEEIQAKLAFSFTSCFSEMLGYPAYMCEKATPIKDCVRSLDSNGHNTFREYFMHTQDMCFYIQHQMWQEETDRAVNQLTNVAVGVTKNLQESKEAQEQILQSQLESVKVQSNLKKDNNALYTAIVKIKHVFDDFKHSADEHRLIFLDIFEKLTRMQKLVSWIQGEMTLLDLMGFYFVCMVFGFIATATRRTRHGRFYIVLNFIASLTAERFVNNYCQDSDYPYSPEEIQGYTWIIRRVAACIGIVILIAVASSFRDLNQVNNSMLMQMNTRMEKLMLFMDDFKNSPGGMQMLSAPSVLAVEDDATDSDVSSDDSYSNYSTDTGSVFVDTFDQKNSNDSDNDFMEDRDAELLNIKPSIRPLGTADENTPKSPVWNLTPNGGHQYNLRTRKTPTQNPILKREGPTAFAKVVKSRKITPSNDYSVNYFSSDDEF